MPICDAKRRPARSSLPFSSSAIETVTSIFGHLQHDNDSRLQHKRISRHFQCIIHEDKTPFNHRAETKSPYRSIRVTTTLNLTARRVKSCHAWHHCCKDYKCQHTCVSAYPKRLAGRNNYPTRKMICQHTERTAQHNALLLCVRHRTTLRFKTGRLTKQPPHRHHRRLRLSGRIS